MSNWNIDPDHSVAAFAIRHMMISNVRGQFNSITGTINFDPANPGSATVKAVIAVSSLATGIRKRDEHLLSPDFFEVEKYPEIHFRSTGVEATGGNKGRVRGDLTIHGVTRPVVLEVEYSGPVKGP